MEQLEQRAATDEHFGLSSEKREKENLIYRLIY